MSCLDEGRPSGGGSGAGGRLLLAASAVLLALSGAFFLLPLLLIAPAPLAALVYRHGYRTGIVTSVFTLFIVGIGQQRIFGAATEFIDEPTWQALFVTAMTVLVTIGLIGIVLGGAWREGASRWQAEWLGVAGALMPALTVGLVFWFGQGVDLVQLVLDAWSSIMRGLVEQSAAAGLAADTVDGLLDMIADTERTFPLMKPLLPGMMFVAALVGVHINGALATAVLSRATPHPPRFAPFATWRFPWPFVLAFVLGHALTLAARFNGSAEALVVGQNLLMGSGFVFAVQGVAILIHVFERRRVGTFFRVAVVLALLWWWPAVLTWFGVLDTWFHFRSRGHARGGSD